MKRNPLIVALALVAPLAAQNGDRPGEDQPPLPKDLVVPAAPVLSPAEQLAGFKLEGDVVIELVAAEPLVVDPVQIAFDELGRLWVCEMRGYMPDADGRGEGQPIGRIVVLEDTDGDGQMDRRVDFMDELVMPRAVMPTRGGALIIAPPVLLYARDTDGDGRADETQVLDTSLGGIENPEHAINGLVLGLDNWFRCVKSSARYRWKGKDLVRGVTAGGGQWGVAFDDWGRAFYNTNPDPLRGDPWPSHYAVRNPNHGTARGINRGYVGDKSVWPGRINPGVNRGYRKGTLRDDYTLRVNTGSCSPYIIRSGGLGESLRGSAIVCEPTGNLLSRFELACPDGINPKASRPAPGFEFLTSTDERFRPVALCGGPDGALYVADLARGLIQHRIFLTSFLRKQIEERGLEEPHALGRIWRIRRADLKRPKALNMADWTWTALIAALKDDNGWLRTTAQRVIVEDYDGDTFVRDRLEVLALDQKNSAETRAHALWTLEGCDELRPGFLLRALGDNDPRVQAQVVRVAEELLSTGHEELSAAVVALGSETKSPALHLQVLHSLGSARTVVGDQALLRLAIGGEPSQQTREALISGLYRRELEFLRGICGADGLVGKTDNHDRLIRSLVRCVVREGNLERINTMLELVLDLRRGHSWMADAISGGILASRPKGAESKPGPVRVARALSACADLERVVQESDSANVRAVSAAFVWPGRAGFEEWQLRPLTHDEGQRFARGAELYSQICAACHQASGLGDPGQAPPLRGQRLPLGKPERLAALLLHGLSGPVLVAGKVWDGDMPAMAFSDGDVAAVATYLRRAWGHGADPVETEFVTRVRSAIAERKGPWSIEELDRFELK
jgi:mono/diheme cytochrome c family protein